jgi:hypothetical protein
MDYRRLRALIARRSVRVVTCIALAAALCVVVPAAAQDETTLAGLLPDVILRDITLPTSASPGLSHSAHFSPLTGNDLGNPAVAIVESFNKLMVVQLSTFPLGSSAGGFTYTFDPGLGTFRRGSSSFGPSFAERASTIGHGRFSVGTNYQHVSYSRIEGNRLDNGTIKVYLRHHDCCSVGSGPPVPPFFGVIQEPDGSNLTPFFEGDVIETALSLNVTTNTAAFFGNYGVTDRWDVAVAVPIVNVNLDAKVVATIQRLATASNPLIHTFVAGDPDATHKTFERSGSATGLGDIVIRTKYRIADVSGGGIAAAADVRLPTGDEKNLLGGAAQAKLMLVLSTGAQRFYQHVNVGYTFSGTALKAVPGTTLPNAGQFPDEVGYAGGVEYIPHPKVTLVGDVVGRVLRDAGRLSLVDKTFQYELPGPVVLPPPSTTFKEFQPRPGNINLVFGTVGAKFNPVGNLLVSGSVLFPLTQAGLRSRVSTVIGVDFAF